MLGRPDAHLIDGPAGALEVVVESPDLPEGAAPIGLAVVAHPNPQQGGTMDNKVVHTLVRAFVAQGWQAVRFNYRGVGASEGAWDEGRGEVEDMLAVIAQHRMDPALRQAPLALAGFSFGGYIAAEAASRLSSQGQAISPLVLISPAVTKFTMPAVPDHTLVIEGELDDVVPLSNILDWTRPIGLPVTVLPGAGHFFHGQLGTLKQIVLRHLKALAS
jgi:alpha/beta superfamily hydrolase